jgi:diamine N-acetyltransferase
MHVLTNEVTIRREFRPATDVAGVAELHDTIYRREFAFGGAAFTQYVQESLAEFVAQYTPSKDCVWLCEVNGELVGSLFLMNRGDAAQLRYFLLRPEYRGAGLGKKLMESFLKTLKERGYRSAYLLTVNELEEAAHLYLRYGFRLTKEVPSTAFGVSLLEQRYDLFLPIIRPARPSDDQALCALMEKTFVDTYASFNTPENMHLHISTYFALPQVQNELQDEDAEYLVIEKKEELIGFAKLVKNHSVKGLEDKKTVEIARIYVAKAYHGQQLGAQLMQTCLQRAKDFGAETVWLGVWEHNPKALRFYEKMGFQRFGEHVFTLGTEVQNDFLMKKEL